MWQKNHEIEHGKTADLQNRFTAYALKAVRRRRLEYLLKLYEPMLIHNAIVSGSFDEDLYQELCITFLRCIRLFRAG